MTWDDLVQQEMPGINKEAGGYVLWNHTAFPFGEEAVIRRQLRMYRYAEAVRQGRHPRPRRQRR